MVRWLLVGSVLVAACSRSTLPTDVDSDAPEVRAPSAELCNTLDDDLDGAVDEDFRDEIGRYVEAAHCGGCGRPCEPTAPRVVEAACALVEETPVCVALACEPGFVPSTTGRCVDAFEHLCLPCADDGECGDVPSARCEDVGGESRCVVGCEVGCPEGFACDGDRCAPAGGSCNCDVGERFTVACGIEVEEGVLCVGAATCEDGVLSACTGREEVCDGVDDDCNGIVDDPFVDERGAYSGVRDCGECGVDCTVSTVPEGDLTCGGDPFAPTCVLRCPDLDDGTLDPGDRIDADRDVATGCECVVTIPDDVPGPVGASGAALDTNCDGADGVVVESFYVSTDGDDAGPGSPTRPLRTLQVALDRAAESLTRRRPRPHVFIASGSYAETVEIPDGVQVHGGYRRDWLELSPDGFRVEVRAPTETDAPGGAALVVRGAGATDTLVEWISVRGRDAPMASAATFGAYLRDPGPRLSLRALRVASGVAGAGRSGDNGVAGAGPMRAAGAGGAPRAALETPGHVCIPGPDNLVMGGLGGRNACGGTDVSGGVGGAPGCPSFAMRQPAGQAGNPAGALPGGPGGAGGQDSNGPIMGISCSMPVCCGLADFTVPTDFSGPQSGGDGRDGLGGSPGDGCRDALGRFSGDDWVPDMATRGTPGEPGSGGGGGGAGGGAEMDWVRSACEFADGLGGGGGGGGAGGCGGEAGRPGRSGGPAVAMLVRYTRAPEAVPTLTDLQLAPSDGGRGGDGGAGGDGGLGGAGGFGGEVPREERSTPTLSGPFPGGRGGQGGNGGPGGGGGGGCGGGSIGIWITGVATEPAGVAAWRRDNDFMLGRGGRAGSGGGGAAAAAGGVAGGELDVVVR